MTTLDPAGAAPPESLKRLVLAAARGRPSPPRRRALPGPAIAALAAGAMLAVLAAAGGVAHADARPAATGAAIVLGALALAAAATWLTLPARRSMLAPARGRLLAVVIGVPVLVGAWLAAWHGTYDDAHVRTGLRCLALTGATAPWPFVALALLSRRLEPRSPRLAGAALGSTAGAWAMVMVELWCPLAALDHVAIGHVLPLALLALAGAAYGGRALRLRRVS